MQGKPGCLTPRGGETSPTDGEDKDPTMTERLSWTKCRNSFRESKLLSCQLTGNLVQRVKESPEGVDAATWEICNSTMRRDNVSLGWW